MIMLELIIYLVLGIVVMLFVTKKSIWFRLYIMILWPFYLLFKFVEYTDHTKERDRKDNNHSGEQKK